MKSTQLTVHFDQANLRVVFGSGTGHVAWELVYFAWTSWDKRPPATPEAALAEERRLLGVYHAELMKRRPGLDYSLVRLRTRWFGSHGLVGSLLNGNTCMTSLIHYWAQS